MAASKSVTGTRLKLNNVRLSFATLHKADVPKGYADSEPKFSCNLLMDPSDAANKASIKQCSNEIKRLIKEAWGTAPPKMKPIECFGKGEMFTNNSTKQPYDGYPGMYAVSANNKKRPTCLARDKTPLTPDEVEQKLYSGCYVDAIINFWVQDNKFGEAIRCSLQGVRFRADGEEFGASGASADDFDDLDDGELMDELDDDLDGDGLGLEDDDDDLGL